MSERYVENGKRWVKNIFAEINTELKDTVVLVHWDLQDHDPEYRLCFQIAGQEQETLCFTRGTLRTKLAALGLTTGQSAPDDID